MTSISDQLEVCTLDVSNRGLVELWKWSCDVAEKGMDEGISPAAGIAAALDSVMLSEPAEAIRGKLKRIEDDEDWEDWKRSEWGLIEKWGDRDNRGELIRDESGGVNVSEHKIEMDKDMEELRSSEKFKKMWERIDETRKLNDEVLGGASRVRLCCLKDLDSAPKTLAPRLMSMLYGGEVRSILRAGDSAPAPAEISPETETEERRRAD